MASKIKVDELETIDGSGTIALQNQLSGMTSASMPTGSVLQVVNNVTLTRDTTSSTSFVTTGITASITPSSTSSKIFVIVSTCGNVNNSAGVKLIYTLYRDSTNLGDADDGIGELRGITSIVRAGITPSYLDSPNTTSSVTYTLYFRTNGSATVEIPGTTGQTRSITLMEIAG